MLLPSTPVHEEARLESVRQYEPFKPFDDEAYAPVLELARDLFKVSTVFVSFVDRYEQVFPVRRGLDLCGTSRDVSFCAHTIT